MSKLTPKHFRGIRAKQINIYIETINEYLNENLPLGKSLVGAIAILKDYLNDHDFVLHEGIAINDETIDEFITRIISENKTNDLNFLPNNKLVNEMTQPVNPLQNLVQDTITVENLLDIYNKYAPSPISMEQIRDAAGDDVNFAKAYLINEILAHARDGTLVNVGNVFGRPVERKGMPDLARIVLDLQRDVTRVKNAISPQGAEALVARHNEKSKPSAYWKLNKRNPNAPATLTNLTDLNNDGVPDVVISNANNQPIFVNGYTTTTSKYPIDLAYYNAYPTRADRQGHSRAAFKKDLYNVTYNDNDEDVSQLGSVASFDPNVTYMTGYDLSKYNIKQPKRMTSFNRFKKYVIGLFIDRVYEQAQVPPSLKLAALSKMSAAAWNALILDPIYKKYQVKSTADANRIKKKAAAEIDQAVDNLYLSLTKTGENWTDNDRLQLDADILAQLIQSLN